MEEERICRVCQINKPIKSFQKHGKYRERVCSRCRQISKREKNPIGASIKIKRNLETKKTQRRMGIKVERWILEDSRGSDKKYNRDNDLTKEFIEKEISNGCSYCGENSLRMTLDRIDNSLGHLQSNVVPACIRCNYARRDMPHEAWLCLVPGLIKARELGLFGDWVNKSPNKKS
jgi:hypothetical protein